MESADSISLQAQLIHCKGYDAQVVYMQFKMRLNSLHG